MTNENQSGTSQVALWNPNAAANWSLLFSPVFGAWLHAKNWAALGDDAKAKQSMYWVYGGIAALLIAIFLPDKIGRAVGIGFLFGWYFSFAKQQVKYVKETLGGAYEKKGWAKPLGIAAGCFTAFIFVIGAASLSFDSEFQQENAMSDISGVWRANQDGAMVTFRLIGNEKSIEINGQAFPVAVKSYDDENKILTMVVNGNSSAIWSVRQIFDNDGRFTLNLTLHDGTQDDLSFVRNL